MLKKIWSFTLKYPVAIILTFLLVAGAVLLAFFRTNIQIGGLLDLIWGRNRATPDVRSIPPAARTDEDGKSIEPGKSDPHGYVQVPVATQIKPSNIFSNPNVLTILHPDKGEVNLPLPTGVKNSDVSEAMEIAPNVYEVRNLDRSSKAPKALDVLDKKEETT